MADVNSALVQQVLDIPQGKRKTDIKYHRQANDLRAGFEIGEVAATCHPKCLVDGPAPFNQVSSDNNFQITLVQYCGFGILFEGSNEAGFQQLAVTIQNWIGNRSDVVVEISRGSEGFEVKVAGLKADGGTFA